MASSLSLGVVEGQFAKYNVATNDVEILIPKESQRVNNPSAGFLAVYLPQIKAGWRKFVPPFFKEDTRVCGLCLSQWTTNAFAIMAGFEFAYRSQGFTCSVERFFALYDVGTSLTLFFYLIPRGSRKKILAEASSSYGS